MTDLETILVKLNGKPCKIFENGELTDKGYELCKKLLEIIYDVESITFDFGANKIVDELDKISSNGFVG